MVEMRFAAIDDRARMVGGPTTLTESAPYPGRGAALAADRDSSLDGYAWDGTACVAIVCGCTGTECDRAATTEEECVADHARCIDGF